MCFLDLSNYYEEKYKCQVIEVDIDNNELVKNSIGYIKYNQKKIEKILNNKNILGLNVIIDNKIINKNILNYLDNLNKQTNLVIEVNFDENILYLLQELKLRKINAVVTLINDFANMHVDKMLANAKLIANNKIHGIRIKQIGQSVHGIQVIASQLEEFKDNVVIYEIPNKIKVNNELIKRNTYQGFNRSILNKAKQIMESNLQDNDIAVDMTVGNGFDTLFLCKLIPNGMVYGFDIQEVAINNTTKLLNDNNISNYKLFLESHENICSTLEPFKNKIKLILFNLGYLPKGDKSILTNYKSTLKALRESLKMIAHNGVILIVCYPHEEGVMESNAIKNYLQKNGIHYNEYHNTDNINAPFLIEISN